jgi:manganese-transporting P-type ATPase
VKKIIHAKESLSTMNSETFYLIILLVIFAAIASSYVMNHGLHEADKNKFRLVLHCIMIITSVVPPGGYVPNFLIPIHI